MEQQKHYKSVKNRGLYNANRRKKWALEKTNREEKIIKKELVQMKGVCKGVLTFYISDENGNDEVLFQKDVLNMNDFQLSFSWKVTHEISDNLANNLQENGDMVRKQVKMESSL